MRILTLSTCLLALAAGSAFGQGSADETSGPQFSTKAFIKGEQESKALDDVNPEAEPSVKLQSQAKQSNSDDGEYSISFIITILFTIVSFYWLHNRITR